MGNIILLFSVIRVLIHNYHNLFPFKILLLSVCIRLRSLPCILDVTLKLLNINFVHVYHAMFSLHCETFID